MSTIIKREDGSLIVKNVILSYPHLFEPWGMAGSKAKYSAKFLLPRDERKDDINKILSYLQSLAVEKFKQKCAATNLFLRDGQLTGKDDDAPFFSISASDTHRPQVVDRDRSVLYPEDADEKMYPGAIVNVHIKPWVQDNQYGRKVNANLLAVQFVRDGERLAAARSVDPNDSFDDISGQFGGEDDGFGGGFDDDTGF